MKIRAIAPSALSALLLLAAGTLHAQGYPQQPQQNYPQQQQQGYPQQQGQYPQQQGQYGQPQGGWDQAPQEYTSDVQRQGFRDGIGAARSDFEQHRQPNSSANPLYRHPPVAHRVRNDYRAGFQRGYDVATRHMMERHDGDHDRDHHDRDFDHRNDGYPQQPR